MRIRPEMPGSSDGLGPKQPRGVILQPMIELHRDAFPYNAYFCEENIWWLAKSLADAGLDTARMRVLLFTNPSQTTLLFNQREAPPGAPVVWDYHVVLQAMIDSEAKVLDFDTRLDFPSAYEDYLLRTFTPQSSLPEEYRAWARVIPAESYLRHFYSDRSHMLGRLPPSEFPDYPIIQPEAGVKAIALQEYRDLRATIGDGSTVQRLSDLYPALG